MPQVLKLAWVMLLVCNAAIVQSISLNGDVSDTHNTTTIYLYVHQLPEFSFLLLLG